ncbi:MAG: DUF4398 domain-containing protein [Nitrospirae bacterium]|nr:DUF4398 domain-containing protein [Nitrospirota bacterium]MCL5285214.1 DUF4398 domain-containing protein [Nitrospirota bacterium]
MDFPTNALRVASATIALCAAIALSSCSSSGPKPVIALSEAKTAVDQADRAGTRNYAAFDLTMAQDKLKKAEKEMKEGDYKEARYLADEAKVDAQLALAKTLKAKTKEAETQLMQSMHSLKHEINNQGSGMQ